MKKSHSSKKNRPPASAERQAEISPPCPPPLPNKSWLDAQVSEYASANAKTPEGIITYREVVRRIRTQRLKAHNDVRRLKQEELAESDSAKRKKIEKDRKLIKETRLPAFTPCGVFLNGRKKGEVSEYSPLIPVDIDEKDNPGLDVARIKDQLAGKVPLVCESPSGGAKVLQELLIGNNSSTPSK